MTDQDFDKLEQEEGVTFNGILGLAPDSSENSRNSLINQFF